MLRRWAFTFVGSAIPAREVRPVPTYRDQPVVMQRLRRIASDGSADDIITVHASGPDQAAAHAAARAFVEAWLVLHGDTEVCSWMTL